MPELIWEGKYKGNKKTAPVRIALPFQTIETVNESAQQRQRTLDLFASGRPTEWRNRLIWGDKKYVLPSLIPEFAGKVNLIYIDPPFDTGADFSFKAIIPDNPETVEDESTSFIKEPSIIEQKAYRDTWGKNEESYAQWFYDTLILLRDLLASDGSIFVHCDWHVNYLIRQIMNEIMGQKNFRNEIIWYYWNKFQMRGMGSYPRNHDVIYWYVKDASNYFFEPQTRKLDRPKKLKRIFWDKEKGRIQNVKDEEGKVIYNEVWDEKIDDVWDIPYLGTTSTERTGFDTQKPEELIEYIIKSCSKENDLVLDCFVGSGTTAAASEKLNRKWIACDLGRFSIHTTRKRLLSIKNVKPLVVQNLGKYELQQWIASEFLNADNRHIQEKAYRNFIIDLFHAQSISGYNWLHGAKSGRMIHIGSVDAPISLGDVKAIIQEFWKTAGKSGDIKTNGIDIIGWDFAFEINETAKQYAAENKVDLKFKKIPREVLDKKAVEQGDIKFFELASLDIKLEQAGKKVSLTLNNFIVPPDDVPEDVRKIISHWRQWIDYWAVDWNYRDDTFHNEWQSYRTKKSPIIDLHVDYTYDELGSFTVLVKVIDILGNDTTKAINVEIK